MRRFSLIIPLALLIVLAACTPKRILLQRAARKGDDVTVRTLLDGGADVNEKDEFGRTALITAASSNSIETVLLLLSHGADVNARDNNGETALIISARQGHHLVVRTLLEKGADVNAADKVGGSPVVYAAQFGHAVTLKVLLDEGHADVQGKSGQLALKYAKSHPDILQMLKSAGAKE